MATVLGEVREIARGWRWGRRPLVPRSAEPWTSVPEPREFPTEWARTEAARRLREAIHRYVLKPLVWSESEPHVHGLDHLAGLRGPVVFVANHASHLDAPLILCSLPRRWRERTAVGAAADYFFDVWWRAAATALVFNAFPVERSGGRRLSDTPWRLLREGWSIAVFPGGPSPRCPAAGRGRAPVATRSPCASAHRCGPRTARRLGPSWTGSRRPWPGCGTRTGARGGGR
jgi:1-acyl-sn-glycerol-3-phosphate acyltransferase